ncbi:hypothetical protein M758_12G060400 [Ceratodon purpureus]|nr:hypothetical protein M758_12G059700 [Ceratodon purpureus]KAG0598278.1 hypothetical protein M758_12G060400 [Ceratodon purpureus]
MVVWMLSTRTLKMRERYLKSDRDNVPLLRYPITVAGSEAMVMPWLRRITRRNVKHLLWKLVEMPKRGRSLTLIAKHLLHDVAKERENFEAEHEALESNAHRSAEAKVKLEAEFRDSKLASDHILAQLVEKNRSLESQLQKIAHTRVETPGKWIISLEGVRVSDHVDSLSNPLLMQQSKEPVHHPLLLPSNRS